MVRRYNQEPLYFPASVRLSVSHSIPSHGYIFKPTSMKLGMLKYHAIPKIEMLYSRDFILFNYVTRASFNVCKVSRVNGHEFEG